MNSGEDRPICVKHLGDGPILTDDRPILEYFLAMPRDTEMNTASLKGDVRQIVGE